jgi:hypothetical protein
MVWVGRAGWALAVLALGALGVLWHLDRTREWEAPRWDAALFEVLHEGPAEEPSETWAVAVNPECRSCLVSLRAALAARDRQRAPLRVAALVVDTPARPGGDLVRALGADAVWWDRDGRWRKRWGHRVYGEVLCFDGSGTLLRVLGPLGADEPPG